MKLLAALSCLVFLSSIVCEGQRRGEVTDNDNTDKIKQATKLGRQAEKLWKDDQFAEAEKLYYKSMEVFPVASIMDEFATRKFKEGDIKGANKVWEDVEKALFVVAPKNYKDAELKVILEGLYWSQANNNFESGNIDVAISVSLKYFELNRGKKPAGGYHHLVGAASNAAFFLRDKQTLKTILEVSGTYSKDMTNTAKFGQFMSDSYLKILNEEYDAAEAKIVDVVKNKGGFTGSGDWAEGLLPWVYFEKGDYVKAKEAVASARAGAPGIISRNIVDQYFSNFYGMLALHEKEFDKAAVYFTTYLNKKGMFGVKIKELAKFKYYTLRAQAYEGLKEFNKARQDYEAALVFKPDYEPALIGLGKLEGTVVTERKTDKTAPEITVTEPAFRGLIVKASAGEMTVRGFAKDPSGIASVTINGEKIYSKEGGDFWGNVMLNLGANKIVIKATDLAGNSSEKIMEIEKTASLSSDGPSQLKEGKNYALLIGCQNYDDSNIPSLEDPIPDAVRLKILLKNNYNFTDENLFTLLNPNRMDFRKKLIEIYDIIQPEDNLVIFYAGHGIWVDKEKKGYWMLTDAALKDPNSWLPNKEVLDMIARIPARHTLLITDACFSGSVFRTRGIPKDAPAAIQQMNEKISRVAITSGNDTEVPDKSVFMKYLVKALSDNKEKYLSAQKMFVNHIIEAVMTETKTEPRYGTLDQAGHLGGDFIFIRK